MKVIVVASQKGGAGKTTLTSHLAVEAERAGVGTVVLIDMDPQGGLAQWRNARTAATPAFGQPPQGGLADMIDQLRDAGVDLVLIDTPPAITESIAATLKHADLVVIPARASPNDLRAVGGTVTLVRKAGKDMAFVINSVRPKLRLTAGAAIQLSQWGRVAPIQVGERNSYVEAMIDGRTAAELEPHGKAATEMAELWSYLVTCLPEAPAHV